MFTYHDQMIIAHAVFASIAVLFTAPAAVLIGRFFRDRQWWFKAHLVLQTLTAVCVIIVFIVGTAAVDSGAHPNQFVGSRKDPHHDIGLSIFILFLLQFILGVVAHYTHSAGYSKPGSAFPTITVQKHALRHVHVFCGIAMTALLYAGMKTGMDEWNRVADAGTLVPRGITIAFWVLFALEVAAYVAGWASEPVRSRSMQPSAATSTEKVAA